MHKKIGIVLSGGGARGIAHIGVLRALTENGIHPQVIAGASAGAIIGSMYAAGKTVEEMTEFIRMGSLMNAFNIGFPINGFASLEKFETQLQHFIQADTFEALQKPLYLAVSNLMTGEPEIISMGPLLPVVIASSSIPLIFKPIEINGQLYVDGGLMMNMPAEALVAVSDFNICVNIRPRVPIKKKEISNLFGIAQRCFDLALQGNIRPNAALCSYEIAPKEIHKYGIFQFGKWKELLDIGYRAGLEAVPQIKIQIQHHEPPS